MFKAFHMAVLAWVVVAINGRLEISSIENDSTLTYLGSVQVFQMFSNKGSSHLVKNRTEVVIFGSVAADIYCNVQTDALFQNMIEEFGQKVVIFNITFLEFKGCFPELSQQYKSIETYRKWCQLNSALVLLKSGIANIEYNKYNTRGELLEECGLFYGDSKGDDFMEHIFQNTKLMGNLTVDKPECEHVFESVYILIFSRIFIGCLLIATALCAMHGFVLFNADQMIGRFVLGVNAILCMYMGVIWILGSHFLTGVLPHYVSSSNITLFSGSNLACDILISLRWKSLNKEVTCNLPASNDWQVLRQRKLGALFGVSFFFGDLIYTYLFIHMSPHNSFYVGVAIPTFLLIVALLVLMVFFKQILFMNKYLNRLERNFGTAVTLLKDGSQRTSVIQLKYSAKELRFWLLIAFIAMVVYNVLILALEPTFIIFQTCENWAVGWSVLAFLRAAAALAQVKLCLMRESLSRKSKKLTCSKKKSSVLPK